MNSWEATMPRDDETTNREHERGVWESLYGPDPACKQGLLETREAFRVLFEQGHSTDIKGIFEDLALDVQSGKKFKYPFSYMRDVHPKAWPIILEHGKHYRPVSLSREKPQEWERQPLAGSCFLNAIEMVYMARELNNKSRAVYVEGFSIGPAVYPMLHAWVGSGFSGKCYDWTFYAITMFTRYFGVPFTYEEYKFMTEKPDGSDFSCMMLFRRDNFKRVEGRMLEVLQKPRTRLLRPK